MNKRVAALVCQVKKYSVTPEQVLASDNLIEDVGIDSLEMIELLLAVENEFGIRIDFDRLEVTDLNSITGLAGFVAKQQRSPDAGISEVLEDDVKDAM
jgi:acyl carrier protein